MITYGVGEVVNVTIKGVRISAPPPPPGGRIDRIAIADERGDIYQLPAQAAIERVAPAEWPPQEKDIWRDRDGDNWFGVLIDDDDTSDGPYVELLPGRSSKRPADYVDDQMLITWHGPFTLVHREEPTP